MVYHQKKILLKDGRTAIFRSPEPEDASALLALFKSCAEETPFLLTSPEDIHFTEDQERSFIEKNISSQTECLILCFVDGKLAGDCSINRLLHAKSRHRGTVGIALLREFWGLGIGTAMFREMIQIARNWELEQLELEFLEGNERGQALYEKMGFRITGFIPNAIHLSDGSVLMEYQMLLTL